MTRPTLVRADSIDLQEQNAPSAKDHTNHPADTGRPAPHHAEALREVRAELAEEKSRSPRVSREWTVGETANLQNQITNHDALAGVNSSLSNHLKQQDEHSVAQNGGMTGSNAEDGDMADAEGDDSMDDDMMDKISSSPSIDDGGYTFSNQRRPLPDPRLMSGELPPLRESIFEHGAEGGEGQWKSWPPRNDSLRRSSSPPSSLTTGGRSSSPFIDSPLHYPLHLSRNVEQGQVPSEHHHHQSGLYPVAEDFEDDYYYEDDIQEFENGAPDEATNLEFRQPNYLLDHFEEDRHRDQRETSIESYDDCFEQTGDGVLQLEEVVETTDNISYPNTRTEEDDQMIPYEMENDRHSLGTLVEEDEAMIPYENEDVKSYSSTRVEEDRGILDEYEDDDDDCDDDEFDNLYTEVSSRFIDSGWGGECLQDIEDIDFEFVYALHTFIATVEGQANAQKGDTMVLLDDSNSYWWLVRVVKDGSIGYLPAEHIETPTERLARLNKHRNIDLSATMLGDQDMKSKNPLKKAIRRRNAKTVTFSAPTYVEASDNDYSSDEEDGELNPFYSQEDQRTEAQESAQDADDAVTVEPLRTRDTKEVKIESAEVNGASEAAPKTSSDNSNRSSSDMFDSQSEGPRSRNGTVRNTDSFFKDDSVETRKITITPALFRDDSSNSTEQVAADPKDLKQRPSLEKLEKDSLTDKNKDDKKKKEKEKKGQKEKKPGMLSGLFKRGKDKKGRNLDDDNIDVEELIMGKRSNENSRSSPVPSKDSQDSARDEIGSQAQVQPQAGEKVQRQPSKLQKQPRSESGSPTKVSPTKESAPAITEDPRPVDTRQAPAPERPPPVTSVQDPSMRLVQPDDDTPGQQRSEQRPLSPIKSAPAPQESLVKESKAGAAVSKIKSAIASNTEPRPEKVKKVKARQVMDEFDSSSEPASPVEEVFKDPYVSGPTSAPTSAPRQAPQRPIPGAFPDSYIATPPTQTPANEKPDLMGQERLSESPVQVSPVEPAQTSRSVSNPPPLMVDTSSQEEAPSLSPVSSPSPELIERHGSAMSRKKTRGDTQDSSTSSTATSSGGTWNDGSLRQFFDDDGEIRDLLTVVYDKSGVVPVGRDHPMLGGLFKEEEAKLKDITNRLDNMLGDWLARKTARRQEAGGGGGVR